MTNDVENRYNNPPRLEWEIYIRKRILSPSYSLNEVFSEGHEYEARETRPWSRTDHVYLALVLIYRTRLIPTPIFCGPLGTTINHSLN